MINYISIKNFRCFEESTLKGFSSINLIGGLNNSGKSALLESILFLLSPQPETIDLLNKYRNETVSKKKSIDKTWDYLFFNGKKSKPIVLETFNNTFNRGYSLNIEKSENKDFSKVSFYDKLKLSNNKSLEKALSDFEIFTEKENTIHSLDFYLSNEKDDKDFLGSFSFNDSGRLTLLEFPDYILNEVAYRPAKQTLTDQQISKLLDISIERGYFSEIINTIQIIDKSIEDIRIIESRVHLSRNRVEYLPIGLFGDAITSTLYMILTLFGLEEGGYLLVDEVENGIHHSKHSSFIQHITSLALQRNIQIFMTTHSSEFITSFNNYRIENSLKEFSYIELARTRNNQIVSNKLSPEVLSYKIESGKDYRGE